MSARILQLSSLLFFGLVVAGALALFAISLSCDLSAVARHQEAYEFLNPGGSPFAPDRKAPDYEERKRHYEQVLEETKEIEVGFLAFLGVGAVSGMLQGGVRGMGMCGLLGVIISAGSTLASPQYTQAGQATASGNVISKGLLAAIIGGVAGAIGGGVGQFLPPPVAAPIYGAMLGAAAWVAVCIIPERI